MRLKTLVMALVWTAILLIGWPRLSVSQPQSYRVVVTAYTCEAHPQNPIYPCGPLRWGGNVNSRGAACLSSWRNQQVQVPGFGTYRCDDTLGSPYHNGLPRVDLRVPTLAEARWVGSRQMTVYHVNGSQQVNNSRQTGNASSAQRVVPTSTPTPTYIPPTSTPTYIPPTSTPTYIPPTSTPTYVPPTPTYVPPTPTYAPPASTGVPPTPTSIYVPPTPTYVPPTPTYAPPTPTYAPPASTGVPPTPTSIYVPPTSTNVPPASNDVLPASNDVPPTPTSIVTPPPAATTLPWQSAEGIIQHAHRYAPKGDATTALARLVSEEIMRRHLHNDLFIGLTLDEEQPVWLVTLWIPPQQLPYGAVAMPNTNLKIAARFFIFDGQTAELLKDMYVSAETVEVMGWLPSQAP